MSVPSRPMLRNDEHRKQLSSPIFSRTVGPNYFERSSIAEDQDYRDHWSVCNASIQRLSLSNEWVGVKILRINMARRTGVATVTTSCRVTWMSIIENFLHKAVMKILRIFCETVVHGELSNPQSPSLVEK